MEWRTMAGLRQFFCKRYRAWISVAACMARQMAAGSGGGWNSSFISADLVGCDRCPQGKQIATEQEKSIMENNVETTETPEVVMCIRCGQRPAVLSKKSGKPTHKLCRECFGKRIRLAWERKNAEKAAAQNTPYAYDAGDAETGPDSAADAPYEGHVGIAQDVMLRLGTYPDVAAWLRERADAEIRSVPGQIVWELKKAMGAKREEQ